MQYQQTTTVMYNYYYGVLLSITKEKILENNCCVFTLTQGTITPESSLNFLLAEASFFSCLHYCTRTEQHQCAA